MEFFDALSIEAIPWEENSKADELVVAASTLMPSKDCVRMEIIFRPLVLDNVKHWQIFDDDKQITRFLDSVNEFEDFKVSYEEEGVAHNTHNERGAESMCGHFYTIFSLFQTIVYNQIISSIHNIY